MRYIEVIPNPPSAGFTAELNWEFHNSEDNREIGSGVGSTAALSSYNYTGGSWQNLDSYVNSYGCFVTIPQVTQSNCGSGKYFALKIPEQVNDSWTKQKNLFWNRWYDVKAPD